MKRILALILACCCVLSLTACKKEPEEPYVPPVQGGYLQETEPVVEAETLPPLPVETEPEETVPDVTEPIPEETEPPTEPEPTYIEALQATHEGNEIYLKYNLLSDLQKEVYLLVCENIEEGHKTFFLGARNISLEELQETISAVRYEHPEFFWYNGNYTVNTMDNRVFSVDFGYYPELMNKFESNKKAFNKVVDALVARAQEKNSILDQEKMIHDYICKSTMYEAGPLDQSAWSCLVERKTVCAGYTKAFQIIMNRLGVPCYFVAGELVTPDKTEPHSWNVLKLVDGYYAVDVTNNDCDEKESILYHKYNFAYSTYEGEYIVDEESQVFPTCEDTRYSFKNTYGIDENVASAMAYAGTETTIASLDEFKYFHEQACRNNGFGDWEVKFVVIGENVLNQILDYLEEQEYMNTYIADIANLNNVSTIQWTQTPYAIEFGDAYGITLKISLQPA